MRKSGGINAAINKLSHQPTQDDKEVFGKISQQVAATLVRQANKSNGNEKIEKEEQQLLILSAKQDNYEHDRQSTPMIKKAAAPPPDAHSILVHSSSTAVKKLSQPTKQ